MKTTVSLLLVLCLVSCSQPKPAPQTHAKYDAIDFDSEPSSVAQPVAVAPGTNVTTTVTKSETAPSGRSMTTSTTTKQTTTVAPGTTSVGGTPVAPPSTAAVAAQGNTAPAVNQGNTVSPFGRPPQPTVPALETPAAANAAAGNAAVTPSSLVGMTPADENQIIPEMSVNFRAAPIDLVLQAYADYVHKILLRSPNIPSTATITLVQQIPVSKKQLIQALDSVLAMNNIAMVPIGEDNKFIKVVLLTEAGQQGMKINELNSSMLPEFGPYDTHVVQLKYTKPSELLPILQQFTKTPSAVLPIEGSGMLVLRDTAENVRVMLDMIKRLDVTYQSDIESEVIPIKYALASDIANALNSLSGSGGGTASFGGSSSAGRTGSLGTSRSVGQGNARGGVGGIGGGAGGNYGGAGGFGQQGGLNSGGGLGGGGGLGAAGASPSFTDRVKSLIDRAGGGGAKGEFQILGQTKIIADERMNALLVFAAHDDMQMIKKVVKQLDVVLAQVLIEAIIMEVTLDNTKTIGISAAQQPTGNNNLFAGGFHNGQQFFPFTTAQQGGSNGFPGSFTSVLPQNMFSYWGKFGNSFDVAIQAAQNDSRVNVLSRPRIQTSHGVEADLFVGSTIPYVDSTTAGAYGGTGVYNSYQQQQVGITLKVKPLINPDGLVVMDIFQEASVQGPASTAVNINGTAVPTINQRQASATVAVKDRDTIILGGMISTSQTKTKSGVPYLKDIPVLGNLFRSSSSIGERVELIVLIRPTVLPTPEAAAAVAAVERRNLPGVRRAEAEIHSEEAARLKQAEEELKGLNTEPTNTVPVVPTTPPTPPSATVE
jgi:type II secretory pathway component GspD/PulD (secretin)